MANPFALRLACHRGQSRLIAVLLAALASLPTAAMGSAGLSPSPGEPQTEAASQDAQRPGADDERAVRLRLPALTATERAWVADLHRIPARARLGFGRAVPQSGLAAMMDAPEHWLPIAEGQQRLVLHVTSPGARGLRLGLRVGALPDHATLAVAGSDGDAGTEVLRGSEIKASLERDRTATPNADHGGAGVPQLFWMPLALGDTATLTITLPAGRDPAEVALGLPRVSHLFALPFTPAGERFSGPNDCHRDVACSDDQLLQRLARATAILLYVLRDGGANACTGTLLAGSDPQTRIPYLITAHHCVPDQRQASTVETFWLHRATSCGGRPNTAPVRVGGGADLLYARKTLDTAFLRLRRAPPPKAGFADWAATLPDYGAELVSVHYPQGQTVKMARGEVVAHWHCADVA